MGRSVTEEISRPRLERANRLLIESDDRIKCVALDFGFASTTWFHRVFLGVDRITPGKYRHQRRSGKKDGRK
jgi:transcriptional regulator GlxA family with amidase domain